MSFGGSRLRAEKRGLDSSEDTFGPGGNGQLKHQLAGLSYTEQLERLKPPSSGEGTQGAEGVVQKRSRGEDDPAVVKRVAAQGLQESAAPLPHKERIQRSFGQHDVSAVQAHVGGAAAKASEAMGARAYASSERVAFKSTPDLHTVAHEAAHVIQQRAGVSLPDGVGRTGDAHERHADAVADRVAAGRSAEGLLDQMARPAESTPTVQLKKKKKEKKDKIKKDPKSPVGAYIRDKKAARPPKKAGVFAVDVGGGNMKEMTPPDVVKHFAQKGKGWSDVKHAVLDEGKDTAFMLKCCDYRKSHVLGIINQMKGTRNLPEVDIIAPGSTSPTSDFDVTFTGTGAIQAVVWFNHFFRDVRGWKLEAGTVFDTNVYAENFIHSSPPDSGDKQVHPLMEPEQQRDNYIQDIKSLVKLRKNMKQKEFFEHRDKITAAITDKVIKAKTIEIYGKADQEYKTWWETIFKELDPKLTAKVKAEKDQEQLVLDMLEVDEGMRAANRIYEEKLLAVQVLIDRRDKLAKDETAAKARSELNLEIRKAHSEALLYANEPYFSGGTVRHVVGNLQAKFGYVLSAAQLLQSFNENLGDIKKDVNNYSDRKKYTFEHAAYRTSKYVFRYTDAGKQLKKVTKDQIKPPQKNEEFWIKSKLLSEIRGSTDPEEQKVKQTKKYIKPYTSMKEIEGHLDKVNVAVNQQARSKKIGT